MLVKKFFGVMMLLVVLILPQTVSAEKTDWFDKNFNFRDVRTVIVFDATINPGLNYGGQIVFRNLADSYAESTRKLKCQVITEAQARRTLGNEMGMDLDSLNSSNPVQARKVIMQNAYRIADAWIVANVDNWADSSYVIPERTVWESRRQTRTYRDRHGNRHEDVYYVQVPVTYPPRHVYVSTIQMTLQAYEARRGEMIFARQDVRDREDHQAQKGMFGRICNSFFEDFNKKIR